MKLQLPNVTLLIYNPDKESDLSAKVLNYVCSMIDFGAVKHLCSTPPTIECTAETIIVSFGTWEEGQMMQAYGLNEYLDTEFLMHIETDGYPVNVEHWSNDFLKYDYIGAVWPTDYTMNNRVGNGGCSIQSKRFRQYLYDHKDKYVPGMSSDIWFCQYMYTDLKAAGITFAPLETAQRFSFELPTEENPDWTWQQSFGFHGRFPWLKEPLSLPELEHQVNSVCDKPEYIQKRKQVMCDIIEKGYAVFNP